VVRLNKPTSTDGDDPGEIHNKKDAIQSAIQRATTQTQKPQYTQISLSHKRELIHKRNSTTNCEKIQVRIQKGQSGLISPKELLSNCTAGRVSSSLLFFFAHHSPKVPPSPKPSSTFQKKAFAFCLSRSFSVKLASKGSLTKKQRYIQTCVHQRSQ